MRRLLVTGGAGFIGANFVHHWLRQFPADRLVVLDALTYAGNLANLQPLDALPNFRFVEGSITDDHLVGELLAEEEVDTLVHFAAESHVDRSILGPDQFLETNVVGTHALLKAARSVWLDAPRGRRYHRFHHVSTDEVYGSLARDDPAFTEATPYAPNSPYAASKAASDHFVRAYYHTYGLEVTTSNCSNNYGPYQFPEKLIPLALGKLLEGKPVPIYGDGSNIRDWLYVEDHCVAIERVILNGRIGETYNIGGGSERTNMEVAQTLCGLVDRELASDAGLRDRYPACPASTGHPSSELISFVKDRPGHDRRYAIDASKTTRELGYWPRESFESGLRKTLRWYLDNESWWQALIDGMGRRHG